MLDKINQPADIKNLTYPELDALASEIRDVIIDTVSDNGGHLASNLGMVEATVALHRVFDSPKDKFIFDVGHQCYTHKLLTGRYEGFRTLRQFGGMSGFTNRAESEHDILNEGHSGTSISAALGIATANKLAGKDDYTVAIVGDGSLTNGMIYEALNNCSDRKLNLIILINDNEMSISSNVGGLHKYLTRIRTSNGYFTFKRKFEMYLSAIPLIGNQIARVLKLTKDALKRMFVKDTIFEDLGQVYVGPVDGHNLEKLSRVLTEAKNKHQCCVVHMITKKGYGYSPAEENPDKYHGVGVFDPATGLSMENPVESFSTVMGDILCDIADKDDKLCAITAAMCEGTGLTEFAKRHRKRFFDVGIAEEHAVTFACGLAVTGMKPVVALYSTFSQRVYDQIFHDFAVQRLPLILMLDRCGIVPNDGITHQGIFDYSMFSTIPGVQIYAPATYSELRLIMEHSAGMNEGIRVVRYPKGAELTDLPRMTEVNGGAFSYTDNIRDSDAVIITHGRLTKNALKAAEKLSAKHNVAVIKLLRTFPVDVPDLEEYLKDRKLVYILDESYIEGGIGEKIAANVRTNAIIHVNAIDSFVAHGNVEELMQSCGFTAEQIAGDIERLLD